MARTPAGKARVTGADTRNPARHRGRNDPTVAPLGDASTYLDEPQRAAWEKFKGEIPWLVASDRALLEIACILRARFTTSPDIGVNNLQVYSAVLSKLGATPADRSRINTPDEPDEDEFFGPN